MLLGECGGFLLQQQSTRWSQGREDGNVNQFELGALHTVYRCSSLWFWFLESRLTACGKEYGVGVKTTDCPRKGSGSLCDRGRAKGLLGGVHHVEEAILVPLPFVDLRDGSWHRDHAVAIDQ